MSMDYHPGPCCDPRVGISLWVRDVFVIAHVASKAPHQSGSPTTFMQVPAQALVQQSRSPRREPRRPASLSTRSSRASCRTLREVGNLLPGTRQGCELHGGSDRREPDAARSVEVGNSLPRHGPSAAMACDGGRAAQRPLLMLWTAPPPASRCATLRCVEDRTRGAAHGRD